MTFDFYEVIDGLCESARRSDAGGLEPGILICSPVWRRPTVQEGELSFPSRFPTTREAPQELLFGANRFRLSDVSMDATSRADCTTHRSRAIDD